ncbi:MAG: hypothetical protein ACTSRJ_05365, partial [Candidatus Hodarchaeales archaeon]
MKDGSDKSNSVNERILDFLEDLDMPFHHNFTLPFQFKERMFHILSNVKGIDFQEVVTYLEKRSPPLMFEYAEYDIPGVEVKTVDKIKGIFLMINPDPRAFDVTPPESMVICHHKIS